MRVAFFIQGWDVPSSRFRVLQYLPYLKEKSIHCDIFAPALSSDGFSHQWLPGPVYHWARHATQLFLYLPSRPLQIISANIQKYDILFIQKPIMSWPESALLEHYIAKRNPNIIFDIDDAVFTSMNGKPGGKDIQIKDIIRTSRLIFVGNTNLEDYVRTQTSASKVMMIPTTVDESYFNPIKKKATKSQLCIGWTGVSVNLRYIYDLIPVLERFQSRKDIYFKIISDRKTIPKLAHIPNVKVCKWQAKTEVEDLQEIDIGIMPLRDDEWTRGKCAFKLIQYMAIGIPAVASPIGANKDVLIHGETGFFAETQSDWIARLTFFIENSVDRDQMGQNALQRYQECFSIEKNIAKMLEGFEQVLHG